MSEQNKIEINTLIKGTAVPNVISINGKDYEIKKFSPDKALDLMDKLSKVILDIRTTFGSRDFHFFDLKSWGDIFTFGAVLAKKENMRWILDIIKYGFSITDDQWFVDNALFGQELWTLFVLIIEEQGLKLSTEKKSPMIPAEQLPMAPQ